MQNNVALAVEYERCNREIAAMRAQDGHAPAWLVELGISDWELEKRMIAAAAGIEVSPKSIERLCARPAAQDGGVL
jgi:hypothetical protein